jgi:hypothetical protein
VNAARPWVHVGGWARRVGSQLIFNLSASSNTSPGVRWLRVSSRVFFYRICRVWTAELGLGAAAPNARVLQRPPDRFIGDPHADPLGQVIDQALERPQ